MQASNRKLVGTWDNFEYRENVHGERMGDKVKFCSITMALLILNGWRIPEEGLKQSMWRPQQSHLNPLSIAQSVYGKNNRALREQCIRHHRLTAFRAAFSMIKLPATKMPRVNIINCKAEGPTVAFPFAPTMFSESSTAGNISVFEDLVINQMGIKKEDPCWEDHLTIWWGDLKTEIQVLSMQGHGVGMDRPFERYRHET